MYIGISNPILYTMTKTGRTKDVISDYTLEVADQLRYICDNDFDNFSLSDKKIFFHETRQAFGRTALVLSGGATLAMYHFGVVKALVKANILPNVLAGSSAGSLAAAFCCSRTHKQLVETIETHDIFKEFGEVFEIFSEASTMMEGIKRKIFRLFRRGILLDIEILKKLCIKLFKDLTFIEAYHLSQKVLNITVTNADSADHDGFLLNYLTTPNVLIYSAVCASCAIPFVYVRILLLLNFSLIRFLDFKKFSP
jgi:predicted acylesterase/phospholipase RssA